jgi:histidinol-phosphatase (PHP family)
MNTLVSLPADTHTHTALCRHAQGMPIDYARAAFAKGLPEICVTDHVPAPGGFDAGSRMGEEDFPAYLEAVAEAARAFPGRVRLGIEGDFHDGCETYLPRLLDATPFDLVLGSIHFIGDWGFDHPANLDRWQDANLREVWSQYFGLVVRLVKLRLFDAVSHFDLPKKFGHCLPEAELRELAAPALDAVAAAGLAIELNTGGLRKPVGEIYPSLTVLRLARERGVPILFGSDAHVPSETGDSFEQAVRLAREAGYDSYVRFEQRKPHPVPL